MSLPELSVHRHVLAYMLSGALILFGVISYQRIGVDRLPKIDFPMLSVTTVVPGANPSVIDASVTNLIESAVNSVAGIESIQSNSLPGVSVVGIQFILEKNIEVAFNEVQAKINAILRELPEDADPPVLAKVEAGSSPIMWLVLQGDRTLQQLSRYARYVLKKRLETVNGVGEVRIDGERKRTIRINLDIQRLARLGLSIQDITTAFRREHLKLPGGYLTTKQQESVLKLDLEYHSLTDLSQLIVAYRNNLPVRLHEVASLEDGLADNRQFASFNGQPAVGLGIVKISNSNSVAIIEEVKRRLTTEILPQLPPGLILTIATDDASLIQAIVGALEEHLMLGTLLAALVVWLFLKSLRSTLIIATAIPVSLLGAVAAIYFAGYTFNVMTLLGLLLLIGVVVDDAIVVLENIYRHTEEAPQSDRAELAVTGTSQVMFAILAATLTLVSIFASVVFMSGIIGRFIRPFAVVVSLGVVVSLFVSITLTPMLCSRYLRVAEHHRGLYWWLEAGFRFMENVYRVVLRFTLNFRWTIVFLTIAVVMSSAYFMAHLGKGFMPDEDESRFIITFKTPIGSNIEYSKNRLLLIERIVRHRSEVGNVFSTIGTGATGRVNQGQLFVNLVPPEQRVLRQSQIIQQIRTELAAIPGIQISVSPVPIIGGQRGEPLQFILKGPDLYQVAQLAKDLATRLRTIPMLGSLDLDLELTMPELRLVADRTKAQDLGIATQTLAETLYVLVGGLDIAKYNDEPGDGERYDIRLQATEGTFLQPEDLQHIYLRNQQGQMVRLDVISRFEPQLGAAVISRYNLQYAAAFYATPTISEGDAAEIVKREATPLLPLGYQIELVGRAKEFSKTVGYLLFAFVTGLILVYMVLASQFNSFIQPLIVMLAQPLAIIGGVFSLWLVGHSLNIYSMIGLVLLIGLVAKNSILLIDLTNQLRTQGYSVKESLLRACPVRMRPVLMTSLTIILALLPAALGMGAGSDTNGPLAVAVIGGMISSTLLTLVVVPAVYTLVEREPVFKLEGEEALSTDI